MRLDLSETETTKRRRRYWYKNFVTECPICGRGKQWRERQFTPPPPKDSPERWDFDGLAYDYCDV